MRVTGTGQPAHGWLVVGPDATIVASDAAACLLLGVHGHRDLEGHAWTSFALPSDASTVDEALRTLHTGQSWRGALHFIGSPHREPLAIEIVPTEAAGGVALMHLHGNTTVSSPGAPDASSTAPNEHTILGAQVGALEAIAALDDPSAAARGVLHALRDAVPFDWGLVLRFVTDEQRTRAEVVAVFPAPMAGIGSGSSWTPLDAPQSGVLASGEPEMATRLSNEMGVRSELRRMPAFGMLSRIHAPLYAGSHVVGALVVYSSRDPFTVHEGMAIERVVRSLGAHLNVAPPREPSPPAAAPIAPHEQMPSPEPPGMPPPTVVAANVAAASGAPARLNALSEVISGVAHELNNPLTSILGYAQIFHSLDGDERAHAVSTIEREAQRAARIVRNLLSFSRQEPSHTARIDIEETIRRVVEVMQYSLEVDNVRTELRFGGVPEIEADRPQMEQVMINLVNNAQQALQPSGGLIVISTSSDGTHVRISVADNGTGVPEEMRDRVFEPFFTTHDVGHGQGMGLSTAYGVIAQHGGQVWVQRSEFGGADFIIQLPLNAKEAPPEESPPLVPAPSRGVGERILVVDDELPIRALTREILTHAGYEVSTASNGDEALRHMEGTSFSLVVTDMRMPGMDGAALYEQICDRWPDMEGRILVVTGDIEGERTSRRLARGDVRFLEKPFDTSALLNAIRDALLAHP